MEKEHIDDVQSPTVDEHVKLLLEDESVIDREKLKNVTVDDLPDWYNENLFREGQKFCKRNIMAIIFASLVGVLGSLSLPQILKVLIYTNKSSIPCLAFGRYVQSIIHTINLQISDPSDSNSNWYKSVNLIRWKHKINSKKAESAGIGGIYNKDMALTQFSLMAYTLLVPETFGIRATPEEEKAYVHLWRVTSYMIGIPNRFNICRKNVTETRELSKKLINNCTQHMIEAPPSYHQMISAILHGLWNVNVTFDKDAILMFVYRAHGVEYKKPLGWYSRLIVKYYESIFYLSLIPYIGAVVRIYNNYTIIFSVWLVQRLPLFAWIMYGKQHSQFILYPKYI